MKSEKGFPPLIPVTAKFAPEDIKLLDKFVNAKHRGKRGAGVRELVVAKLKEMYPARTRGPRAD